MTRATFRIGVRSAANPAAALAIAALLAACGLPELAGGSSSTETGEKVAITGRVTSGGHPVPGIAVALARAGLRDTTDATGIYRLIGRVAAKAASAAAPDTLLLGPNGGMITRLAVTDWTGALPDLQIVQRGFSGSLLGGGATVFSLVAVLKGGGGAVGDSVTAEFHYNALTSNYSGFLYFPPPDDTVRNYTARIDAFDAEGGLTGRSQTVTFNSLAGNVTIPAFDPGNLASPDSDSP